MVVGFSLIQRVGETSGDGARGGAIVPVVVDAGVLSDEMLPDGNGGGEGR